jgi:hypothetical protein
MSAIIVLNRRLCDTKEEGMKKVALIIALVVLFAAVSDAAVLKEDKDFATGLKYYNSKNYNEAIKHFKEYTAKKPDPTAYYLIGYSLYKLGKFGEADEYFKEAFFIDPEFSLEKAGLVEKIPEDVVTKEPASPKQPTPATRAAQPATSAQPVPSGQKPAGSQPVQPAPAAPSKPSAPGQKVMPTPQPVPPAPVPPPMPAPVFPKAKPGMPPTVPATGIVAGILGGMLLFVIIVGIVFYLFFAFCLYKIAQKLDVPYAWLAFVPLASLWTFVVCAGKPGWWILLFLVPIVNMFVGIYLWMCITENLGKNKWLGLLILVPFIGMFYPAWLAFSKTEAPRGMGMGETLA